MDTATQNKIRKTLSTIHAKNQQAFKDKAVFADRPHLKIDAATAGNSPEQQPKEHSPMEAMPKYGNSKARTMPSP